MPSSTCIQLAGLHAQVLHGDYEEENIFRYTEVDSFLCKRVLESENRNWPLEISLAHKVYMQKIIYNYFISFCTLRACTMFIKTLRLNELFYFNRNSVMEKESLKHKYAI